MKRKPLTPPKTKAHGVSPLSNAPGMRQVGPSLYLHTASRLLISTGKMTIRALNPLTAGRDMLTERCFSEFWWLCENMHLLNDGYKRLLNPSTNFTIIKQPDFDFTRVVPILKIKICSVCKQFAYGNQETFPLQEKRRHEHYKESPQCTDSPVIMCQGVATKQRPIHFLIFCDCRTERMMRTGKKRDEREQRKLAELKELLEVADISAKEDVKETKFVSPRRLRRMSDDSDIVRSDQRTQRPKRKLRRLSEIEKEVVTLANPDGTEDEATIDVSDDTSESEMRGTGGTEKEDGTQELFEETKEGPIDDPESPYQQPPSQSGAPIDNVEEANADLPPPAPQQSFAEFIYVTVETKMAELADSVPTKKKTNLAEMYKLIDPDASVAKRRVVQSLLEFLKSELIHRSDVSYLVGAHLHPTPLQLIVYDVNQNVCMGVQITRVIDSQDVAFTVRIRVFLERNANPFDPQSEAESFEVKRLNMEEVCTMMEMLQLMAAAVLSHIGAGLDITGHDMRDVVALCVRMGFGGRASWVLFQRHLKNTSLNRNTW